MLSGLTFDWTFFFDFIFRPSPVLLGGVAITVYASVLAELAGVVLGTLSALAGMSRHSLVRGISSVYVWFFRGTPVLVQMFLLYYGTPYLFGRDLFPTNMDLGPATIRGAIVAGTVALGICEGAYMSEIVRAGILSVDPGQTEAAKSLGMTSRLTMTRIILPQALKVIIPPLGNNFNSMLKTTSLLSIIGVSEMFRAAQAANSATFKSFEAFLGIALYYLVLTTTWNMVQTRIERRVGASSSVERQPGLLRRLTGLRHGPRPTIDGPSGGN